MIDIVCRVDAPPAGFATRRVYRKHGIHFSYDRNSWEMYLPNKQSLNDQELAALAAPGSSIGSKWIETVPGSEMLATRRPLWRKLKATFGMEQASTMMAETFLLNTPEDIDRLAAAGPDEMFVLKSGLQRRKGIRLASAAEAVQLKDQFLVAERFVSDQVRFQDTTFHLRCYVLLTLENRTLSTWLFEDTICGWAIPSKNADGLFQEWITHPDNEVPDDYPCSLSELCDALGMKFDSVWWSIAERLVDMIPCCTDPIGKVANTGDAFYFQHFGVDVVLRADQSPSVCEINRMPEMEARNPRYAAIKDKVLTDGLAVAGIIYADSHGFVKVFEQSV